MIQPAEGAGHAWHQPGWGQFYVTAQASPMPLLVPLITEPQKGRSVRTKPPSLISLCCLCSVALNNAWYTQTQWSCRWSVRWGLVVFWLLCSLLCCLMVWFLPCAEHLRSQPSWYQQSLLALQSLKCSIHHRCSCSCFFQGFFQTSEVYKQLSNTSKMTSTNNTVWHLYRVVWRHGLSNCVVSSYNEWEVASSTAGTFLPGVGFGVFFPCIYAISIHVLLTQTLWKSHPSPVLGLSRNSLVNPKYSVWRQPFKGILHKCAHCCVTST